MISAQRPSAALQNQAGAGITELVLTRNAPEQSHLLLPMVAHLSQSYPDRWLTWVNPGVIDRHALELYGVDTRCIRLIHTGNPQDVRWIAWEALATGTSHTVIAAPGKLTWKDVQLLEEAAQRGQSQGLLLRLRH